MVDGHPWDALKGQLFSFNVVAQWHYFTFYIYLDAFLHLFCALLSLDGWTEIMSAKKPQI